MSQDQEPVFPAPAQTSGHQTHGIENALRYLEAAATALKTNATYSLPEGTHSTRLLKIADEIATCRACAAWVLDDLTQGSTE